MDREAWRAVVHRVAKSRTRLKHNGIIIMFQKIHYIKAFFCLSVCVAGALILIESLRILWTPASHVLPAHQTLSPFLQLLMKSHPSK